MLSSISMSQKETSPSHLVQLMHTELPSIFSLFFFICMCVCLWYVNVCVVWGQRWTYRSKHVHWFLPSDLEAGSHWCCAGSHLLKILSLPIGRWWYCSPPPRASTVSWSYMSSQKQIQVIRFIQPGLFTHWAIPTTHEHFAVHGGFQTQSHLSHSPSAWITDTCYCVWLETANLHIHVLPICQMFDYIFTVYSCIIILSHLMVK